MSEIWTILIITMLSGPVEGGQSLLLYPSAEACRKATHTVGDSLAGAYDFKMECRSTSMIRVSLRPKARP